MGFWYQDRLAEFPLVATIWEAQAEVNGSNLVTADGNWDIQIRHNGQSIAAFICGPTTQAAHVAYLPGTSALRIRFSLETYMPQLPAPTLTNATIRLLNATPDSFWLGDRVWPFPTYDSVEIFVEKLVQSGLVAHDAVIDAALEGEPAYFSLRSVQRRFVRTTGLSHRAIQKIERARDAVPCLNKGSPS